MAQTAEITNDAPLAVREALFDPTGLVAGKAVLCDNTFAQGTAGWTQLFTPKGSGGDGWRGGTLSRVTRAIPRLHLRTPNVSSITAMGIKRLFNLHGDGRHLVEYIGNLSLINLDTSRPQWFGWGLDYEKSNGARRFAYFRFLNYNETTGNRDAKFQFHSAAGYIDIAGADSASGVDPLVNTNENKTGPQFYLAFVVNTDTGFVEGFRYNNQVMLGALKANATQADVDAFKATYGQAYDDTDLPAFLGGINPMFDIQNRVIVGNGNSTAVNGTTAVSEISWARVTNLDVDKAAAVSPWVIEGDAEEMNVLFSNYPIVAGNTSGQKVTTPEIVMEPGAVYDIGITLDILDGSPTAGTYMAEAQVAPLTMRGLNIDAETSGIVRPWTVLAASDGYAGSMLVNGDFPATIADVTAPTGIAGRHIVRSVRGSANARLLRIALWCAGVTGGATPTLKVSVVVSRRRE